MERAVKIILGPCAICKHKIVKKPRSVEDDRRCLAYPEGIPLEIFFDLLTGIKKSCNPDKPDIKWEIEEDLQEMEAQMREGFESMK